MWKPIITGIATTVFGGAIGFGISQASLATIVRVQSVEITHLQQADARLDENVMALRREESAHMKEVVDLFKEHIKLNQSFIEVLKVQNDLLLKGVKP